MCMIKCTFDDSIYIYVFPQEYFSLVFLFPLIHCLQPKCWLHLMVEVFNFLLLIIPAVMFLQTVLSFSSYAGFVGGSLCDAEEELGTL